jgi:hypothetical protein
MFEDCCKELKVYNTKCIVYQPKVFAKFIYNDQKMIDIETSFCLNSNFNNIYE